MESEKIQVEHAAKVLMDESGSMADVLGEVKKAAMIETKSLIKEFMEGFKAGHHPIPPELEQLQQQQEAQKQKESEEAKNRHNSASLSATEKAEIEKEVQAEVKKELEKLERERA